MGYKYGWYNIILLVHECECAVDSIERARASRSSEMQGATPFACDLILA